MRILIGHMASGPAFQRFVEAQKWQRLLGDVNQAEHIIVTDHPESSIYGMSVVHVEQGDPALFNLSKMRNVILDYAINGNYDGMMILEADFLVLRWCSEFPKHWAIPFAVYDHPTKLSFMDLDIEKAMSRRHWTDLGSRALIPVHCVMLNKSVFGKARWDEKFEGVGYDDWDFNNQLHNAFGAFEATDMLLCHRFHETSCLPPRPENRAYFESKWGPLNV